MSLKNKSVLVIAPQPFFSPRGTPFSVYYRTMVMAEMGLHIDMVTYGEGQDVDLPNVAIHRIPSFPRLGPIRIGPSLHKLFLDVFIFLWTFRRLLSKRYDVVHAHEEAVFFCMFLKPIFRFQLIYDMHSSLPQQLTNFNFTTSRMLIGIFQMLENQALRSADAVITICPDLAAYVRKTVADGSKHVMIENSLFEPVKINSRHDNTSAPVDKRLEDLLAALAGEPKLVVYAGTLEPYQGIDILLNAMRIVHRSDPDARLAIAGGSPQQVAHYRQLANRLEIASVVIFTGQVPQCAAQRLAGLAKVQVSPRATGTNTPLKIYSQLASGIPLVATNIYSHTQTIGNEVAFMVDLTPESMAAGILEALNTEEKARQIARAAKQYYQDYFSRPVYTHKMRKIVHKLGLCAASAE